MNKKVVLLIVAVFVVLPGCCTNKNFKPVDKICLQNQDISSAMKNSEKVLNKMNFKIEKSDPQVGYIRTRPLTAAQIFEFWKKDTIGAFNTAESNLHSIRRIVELNFSKNNSQLCIDCRVNIQRLSIYEKEEVRSERPSEKFYQARDTEYDEKLRSLERLDDLGKKARWIDLGRDAKLETKILEQIQKI